MPQPRKSCFRRWPPTGKQARSSGCGVATMPRCWAAHASGLILCVAGLRKWAKRRARNDPGDARRVRALWCEAGAGRAGMDLRARVHVLHRLHGIHAIRLPELRWRTGEATASSGEGRVNEPQAFIVAIPARYASTRLPGKPLRLLGGEPLIAHVARRARAAGAAQVVVATDDARIVAALADSNIEVCLTRADHASGSDRLAECAVSLGWPDDAVVVNLQGDEPFAPASGINAVAGARVVRSQLREGRARRARSGAVLLARAGAVGARCAGTRSHGRAGGARSVAAYRDLRLPRWFPQDVRALARDAAGACRVAR